MPLVQSAGTYHIISVISSEPWVSDSASERFSCIQRASVQRYRAPATYSVSRPLSRSLFLISDMVRTRGGSRVRPRVRFSTPERETAAPVPAPVPSPVPEAVPDEPLGFRRYQTRMGPRAPSPVPQRRARRARPSKRARTSGPGESSSSRPPPSPVTAAEETSSPQLSPASRIRRPMFVGHPIPGNADLHSRPFQQESFYDVPGLMGDPRYQESMRLIDRYSLLPFMTPIQFYYPRVVRQFYHSMTSKDADGPLEIHFRIDDRRGVLSPAVISAALRLRIPPRNAEGYRDWAHPPHREMVRALARDATAGPVLYRRQLPPHMLLINHLLRTCLFPLQHYVQRRGPILEALYRISGNFWFSPSELVMTSLLHFEEKVHRRDLARAESIPLLMSRLLSYILEQMGFPEEPGIEMRDRCPHIVSVDRVMIMLVHFHIRQRDQEEVPGEEAEDAHRDDPPAPAPEVQRSPTPISDRSPPSPPHTTSAAVPTDTPGPSYSAHQSSEYTHVSSREMAGVMDAICTLAATQAAQHAAQEQRLTQCYTMLHQIMTHLGLPHDPAQREEPATDAASLDVLASAAAASHPPPPQQ